MSGFGSMPAPGILNPLSLQTPLVRAYLTVLDRGDKLQAKFVTNYVEPPNPPPPPKLLNQA